MFLLEIWPRTFTIELYEKRPTRSEIVILESTFPFTRTQVSTCFTSCFRLFSNMKCKRLKSKLYKRLSSFKRCSRGEVKGTLQVRDGKYVRAHLLACSPRNPIYWRGQKAENSTIGEWILRILSGFKCGEIWEKKVPSGLQSSHTSTKFGLS